MTPVDKIPDDLFANGPPIRAYRLLHLAGQRERHGVRRAVATAALSWVPVVVLTAVGSLSWGADLKSLASDIAFHVRALVATPLLIIAESFCAARLSGVARHFLDAGLVPDDERARFEEAVVSTVRLRDTTLVELSVGLLAYATSFGLARAAHGGPVWRMAEDGPVPLFSPAGWWHWLVSTPVLLTLVLGWLWRVIIWLRFLWRVAHMRLVLIPAHPDLTAGLRFVSYSVRAFLPVAFGFGCIVAGTVANGVVVQGNHVEAYRYTALGLVVFVVVLFGAPLLVFSRKLQETWRVGVFQYGGIADALGREFEHVWFRTRRVDQSALGVQDFSATVDLYQFVENVYKMRLVPFDLTSFLLLTVAALLPFVPIVLVALPFDLIVSKLAGLWL